MADPDRLFRAGVYEPSMLDFWDDVLSYFYRRLPLARGTTLLDIGCGRGRLVAWARQDRIAAYGVEPNWPRPMAERWIARGLAEALPFKAGSFDELVSFSVLPYVTDPSRCFSEMARVLRESGRAHIAVPELAGYAVLRRGNYRNLPSTAWLLEEIRNEPTLALEATVRIGLKYLVPLVKRTLVRAKPTTGLRLLRRLYLRTYPAGLGDLAFVTVRRLPTTIAKGPAGVGEAQ